MRRADAAEWLLSLTTAPERAAATAGDLVEEAASRGPLWFWWSLLRTTASLTWRSFADAPLPTASVALRACLLEMLIFGFAIIILIVGGILGLMGMASLGIHVDPMVFSYLGVDATVIVCYFLIGKFIGRRSAGKELASLILFLCMDQVLWLAIHQALPTIASPPDLTLLILSPLILVTYLLAIFAGIERGRQQSAESRLSAMSL